MLFEQEGNMRIRAKKWKGETPRDCILIITMSNWFEKGVWNCVDQKQLNKLIKDLVYQEINIYDWRREKTLSIISMFF